jgi:anti-sigma regulatory factor (Ser/Thr protein kinase)
MGWQLWGSGKRMAIRQTARSATMPDSPAADGAGESGLSHQAFFYRGQPDYLANIKAFAVAGLANGEPVFIAVPGRNGSVLRDHLGGRVCYADMAQLGRNPARIIPEVRDFIDAHPGQRVRYVGEPIWPGRSAAEMCEAARHEALINLAFSGMAATILCPYDAAGLPPSVVGDAERTHPAILTDGHPSPAPRYTGPGNLPPRCDRSLPAPPATAEILGYQASLQPVRRLVAGHGRRAGLPSERAADLVLAASEIAGNTLRHTGAGGTVHVWHTDEEMLCQIQDQGWITDPLAGRIRQPPDERGHGLWVVNQVCDLVEMRTGQGGTTIRMHMNIREP